MADSLPRNLGGHSMFQVEERWQTHPCDPRPRGKMSLAVLLWLGTSLLPHTRAFVTHTPSLPILQKASVTGSLHTPFLRWLLFILLLPSSLVTPLHGPQPSLKSCAEFLRFFSGSPQENMPTSCSCLVLTVPFCSVLVFSDWPPVKLATPCPTLHKCLVNTYHMLACISDN